MTLHKTNMLSKQTSAYIKAAKHIVPPSIFPIKLNMERIKHTIYRDCTKQNSNRCKPPGCNFKLKGTQLDIYDGCALWNLYISQFRNRVQMMQLSLTVPLTQLLVCNY